MNTLVRQATTLAARQNSWLVLRRTMAKVAGVAGTAKPAAKAKKGQAAQTKKVFEVETDANKLVSVCCGLNYMREGGEEVVLKADSEYPAWLFEMDVERPEPSSHQMEPGTMAYFRKQQEEEKIYRRTLSKKKDKDKNKT